MKSWGKGSWGLSPGSACGGALILTKTCARLRATIRDGNDLSINVLELVGMVATALIFVTHSNVRPIYAQDPMLMRGEHIRR